VDVRDVIDSKQLAIKDTFNKSAYSHFLTQRYLVKVDILEVLRDPEFFLRSIATCERNRAEEIERLQRDQSED